MSLATRCTACGTVFRVVQDQLKVSSGWVRCGRCGEVFNAIESLVDVAPERPESASPVSVHGPRVMAELARLAAPGTVAIPDRASPEVQDVTRSVSPANDITDAAEAASTAAMTGDKPVTAATPAITEPAPALASAQHHEAGETAAESSAASQASDEVPGFVHRAARQARWRHPAVRGGLALLSLTGMAALALQVASSHHDWVAARWPTLRPAVSQACRLLACEVLAPRHLAGLSVESSSLQRQRNTAYFVLTVSLRNRSQLAARMPAMDLVLSDASGQPAVRRVMTPGDFGVEGQHIDAGASVPLIARIQVRGQPILGYTVELFYP